MSSTEMTRRPPEQELVARVREPLFREQVAMALPPSVTVDHFIRLTTTALLANQDLAEKADHQTILRALVQSAAAGLIPDGKEAAIVVRGGKAVFQPMIGGFRKIAAEHGWTLKTKAVYESDLFEHVEEPESIKHIVRPGVERGALVAAYAKATHKDGRILYRVMYADQIAKRRDIATTKQVWDKWPAEMAEKTAGRDLFADLPLAASDLERERIKALLAEVAPEPGDAQTLLYGSERVVNELPAADPPSAVGGTDGDASQQTDGAAEALSPETATEAAPSAPGPDEEPSLEEDVQTSAFTAPASAGVDDDSITIAAQHAALFHPPNGAHKEMTLGEILAVGAKGEQWFKNRLDVVTEPPEYVTALWSFTRVYLPEVFQAALAKREAEAA
jgi:recombination protein RecT